MKDEEIRAELAQRDRLLVTEAAFLFRRGRRTIHNWVQAGLPAERDRRGRVWVKRADVAEFIADTTHRTYRPRSNRNGTT